MSDLVERLRNPKYASDRIEFLECRIEAADEIERLTDLLDRATARNVADVEEIERLQKQHDNFLQEFWKTNAENERLRAGINKAGSLALQKASHELIRQVLSEALRDE